MLHAFPHRRAGWLLLIALLAITAFRLWLMQDQRVWAMGSGADDYLFLDCADHIAHGQWMGPFDQLRLVKGPGYPLFLAAGYALHVPAMLAQHLFVLGVYWMLVWAIRPWFERMWPLIVIFAVMAMNPVQMGPGSWLLFRDGIYPEQCVLAAACLLGLLARVKRRRAVRMGWAAAAGLALGWVYISREEGVWIAPAVAVLLLAATWQAFRRRAAIGRWDWLGFPAIPLGLMGAVVLTISVINYRVYGMFGVVEFKEANFAAAMGAVQRAQSDRPPLPQVQVSHAALQKLYEVSPSFAKLQLYFEHKTGDYYQELSREMYPNLPQREVVAAYWIWEFRQGVAYAGYYKDFPTASAFYKKLAEEINAAVDSGKVPGGPKRSSISPPWRWSYMPAMLARTPELLRHLILLDYEKPGPERLQSACTPAMIERYAHFMREDPLPPDDAGERAFTDAYHGGIRYKLLVALQWLYFAAGGVWMAGGLVAAGAALWMKRWRNWAALAWLALMLGVAARAALLLFIDASSIETVSVPRYTAPAETFLLLANVIAVVAFAARSLEHRRRAANNTSAQLERAAA